MGDNLNYSQISGAALDKTYRYWRLRIFFSMYLGYVVFYLTRKSYTFVMPSLADDLGLSMSQLGILGSVLYLTYGASKFIGGVISDRTNPRYFMSIGLFLTGVVTLGFGMSNSVGWFALFCALNGVFQGWGWPACSKLLTYWYEKKERGFYWSLTSTSHNAGGALVPVLVAACLSLWGWRWGIMVPSLIAIVASVILFISLRDVPQSLGLPDIETYRQGQDRPAPEDSTAPLSVSDILFRNVLSNPAVWILAGSYFFVYIVRTAVNDWAALYLVKQKNYSLILASAGVTWFEVGGFVGSLFAGWASDRFYQGRRVPYIVLCGLLTFFAVLGFWSYSGTEIWFDYLFLGILGFLIFGPQMLVGLAAAEIVDKKAACTANGFAGCFAYVGAAATGMPLGYVIDRWQWDGYMIVLCVASLAIFFCLMPLYSSGRSDDDA